MVIVWRVQNTDNLTLFIVYLILKLKIKQNSKVPEKNKGGLRESADYLLLVHQHPCTTTLLHTVMKWSRQPESNVFGIWHPELNWQVSNMGGKNPKAKQNCYLLALEPLCFPGSQCGSSFPATFPIITTLPSATGTCSYSTRKAQVWDAAKTEIPHANHVSKAAFNKKN